MVTLREPWEAKVWPLVFFETGAHSSGFFARENWLQFLVVVVTNFGGVYLIRWAQQRRLFYEFWIFVGTLVTSTIYHTCDTFPRSRIFWMNEGQWHRLDNVCGREPRAGGGGAHVAAARRAQIFSILVFQSLALHLNLARSDSARLDKYRWGFLVVTVMCQEFAPWRLETTIAPIALAVALSIGIRVRGPLHRRVRIEPRRAALGIVAVLAAVLCFSKGLDEDADYLRLWHGGWHVFVTLAVTSLYQSADPAASDQIRHLD